MFFDMLTCMKSEKSQQTPSNFFTVVNNSGLESKQSFRQVVKKSEWIFNTWSTLKKCRLSPCYYIICQHLSIQTVKQSEFFYKVTTVRLQPNCTSSSAFWVELMSNCNDKGPCYTERWSFAAKSKVIGGGWAQNAEAAAIFILLINTKTSFCLLLRFWESVVFF